MAKLPLALALAALGCNAPEPPGSTGGTDEPPGPCGRGFVVVSSDYGSTNVSLVGMEGQVLSSSFISSATSDTKLTAKLSGDVILPTTPMSGTDVVLLDESPGVSVLTWVDVKSASVTGQLPAAIDFAANPHDLIPLAPDKAYVTRFDPSPVDDTEAGSDVLIVDPTGHQALSRIDLSSVMVGEDPKFLARPSRGAKLGDRVLLVLEVYSRDWDSAPSRLVAIDPSRDAILEYRVLDGLHGCAGFSPSPDGSRIAISCLGRFKDDSGATPEQSGLVVLDAGPGLAELERFPASDFGAPLGFGLAWASDSRLLFTTSGSLDSGRASRTDTLKEISIDTGQQRELLASDQEAFVLGDVSCAPSCKVCFATDAERNVIHGFRVDDSGEIGTPQPIVVDSAIGLPPRALGRF